MTDFFDASLTDTSALNGVGGAKLGWPKPIALPAEVELPLLGKVKYAVEATKALPVPLGSAARLLTTLEVVVGLDLAGGALAGPVTVFDVGAARLRLVPQGAGEVVVQATAVTVLGERSVSSTVTLPASTLEVCVVVTDGALSLVVDNAFVARRPLESALQPLVASGVAAAQADDTELFAGRLVGLRVGDSVPAAVATWINDAADAGVGEIDAYAAELASLGAPLEGEQVVGLVRWRRYSGDTVVWTPATGVHAVTGPIEDRYWELGGPLGVLGALVGPEEGLGGYLDTHFSKSRKPGAGLRWEDLVVERVADPPRIVDFQVEPGALAQRLEGCLEPRTDLGQATPVLETFRHDLATSMLATEPEALAHADVRLTPQAENAVAALRIGRLRINRVDGNLRLERATPVRIQVANPRLQHVGVPVQQLAPADIEVEQHMAEEVTSLATAFVRNDELATTLTRLGETPTEMFGQADAREVPLLIRASDRVGGVARVIDTAGIGWILKGPRIARFERGIVVWAPGTGAIEVLTDVAVHWLRLGGTDGLLGLPTERDTAVAGGRRVRFAGGSIYWSPETGGHEVHGDIARAYDALGGPAGFGFPTTDEQDCPGGRMSSFQGGDIYWSPGTGAHVVRGAIREAYLRTGGPDVYGLPTGDEYTWTARDGSGVSAAISEFSSGRVLAWTAANGVFDHVVLDLGSVTSGDIDDEVTSDDQPELYVNVTIWVDGAQVANGRSPAAGYGPTTQQLDGFAPVTISLRVDASVRLLVEAWDEDTGPDDKFAVHDVTYGYGGDLFGWLDGNCGSHVNAKSTWDSGDAGPDTFKTSYKLAPPFDELARFGEFRQQMFFGFGNFTTDNLDWNLYAETFEDVVETNDNAWEDLIRLDDSSYYKQRYRDVAEKGNCFGFSALASNTFHRRTGLAQPLVQRGMDPVVSRMINLGQGLQTNEAVTILRQLQFAVAGVIDPRRVFTRVERSVAEREPVLLCMRGRDAATKASVGHCTIAYRTDGSSWPKKIWIADSNFPSPGTSDDQSRIEIDADGTWRMYEGSATASKRFGASKWTGTLGDSFLYDTPLGLVQPPNYTPSWLVRTGLLGMLAGLFIADGAVTVGQVSGGGYEVFGDQRVRLVDGLRDGVAKLNSARDAGMLTALVRPEALVPVSTTLTDASPGLIAMSEAGALADHLRSLTIAGPLSSALGEATVHWPAAESSWAGQQHGTLDEGIRQIDEVISEVLVDAVLAASRQITPGAWPGMAYVPVVEQTDSEMFALRGLAPHDVRIDLLGLGGHFSQSFMTRSSGGLVSGQIGNGEDRSVRLDRIASPRPGLRVTSSEVAATELLLTSATDLETDHWLAWQSTLEANPDREIALERDGSTLGVRLSTATDAPVTLRSIERAGQSVRSDVSWRIGGLAGATIIVEPDDPASPFGSRKVRSFDVGGALLTDVVVDPMG